MSTLHSYTTDNRPNTNRPIIRSRSVFDLHDDPLARQQVKDAPKDQRHQRAAKDDDVVWHGEIRRRKIDEECGGVHPHRDAPSTQRSIGQRSVANRDWEQNSGRKVPAPHGIRGMFGIL